MHVTLTCFCWRGGEGSFLATGEVGSFLVGDAAAGVGDVPMDHSTPSMILSHTLRSGALISVERYEDGEKCEKVHTIDKLHIYKFAWERSGVYFYGIVHRKFMACSSNNIHGKTGHKLPDNCT